jgi:SAM-dependent methyltransferase
MKQAVVDIVTRHRVLLRAARRRLARAFLRGNGLEIGALHMPLPLPRGASARYVDRMSHEDLRCEYPELRAYDLVEVDVIDDGETLATVADASVDFVVANHFIEHTENPIATLRAHLRVVRPGGVLFLAVPDKRYTFDRDREVTPLEHFLRDEQEGPAWSRVQHFEEWARDVEKAPEKARELDEQDYSIHFHTFVPDSFARLIANTTLPVAIEALTPVRHEFIAVLRHVPEAG